MNRSESKYFNTARLMDEALLALLESKELEYITVKELCVRAGVNRSTFYLHYETLGDLLAECLESVNRQFSESFATMPDRFLSEIGTAPLNALVLINSEILRPYLCFVRQHRSVFRAAYKNPACMRADKQYRDLSDRILRPIMQRFHVPEKEQTYWISFYIHGSMAVIREWINGGCAEPVEEIESILLHCIRPENGLRGEGYGERGDA